MRTRRANMTPSPADRKRKSDDDLELLDDSEDDGTFVDEYSSSDDEDEDDNYELDSFVASEDEVRDAPTSGEEDGEVDDNAEVVSVGVVKKVKRNGLITQFLNDATSVKPSTTSTPIKTVSPKKRGRPRKDEPPTPVKKLPGDITFPLNSFSLTVAKVKLDIDLYLLDAIHEFLVQYAVKGGVATETHKLYTNLILLNNCVIFHLTSYPLFLFNLFCYNVYNY